MKTIAVTNKYKKNTNAPLEKDTPVRETYRWYTGFRLVAPRK